MDNKFWLYNFKNNLFQFQGGGFSFGEIDIDLPPPCHPHLDYIAPERILGSSNNTASDMFSVGLLFYSVHNQGKPLLINSGCSMNTIKQNFNSVSFYNLFIWESYFKFNLKFYKFEIMVISSSQNIIN